LAILAAVTAAMSSLSVEEVATVAWTLDLYATERAERLRGIKMTSDSIQDWIESLIKRHATTDENPINQSPDFAWRLLSCLLLNHRNFPRITNH